MHIAFDEYRNPLCSIKSTTARSMEYRIHGVKSSYGKKEIAFVKSLRNKKKKETTSGRRGKILTQYAESVDNFGFTPHCPHYVAHLSNYSRMTVVCQHSVTNTIFCMSICRHFQISKTNKKNVECID